MCPAGRQSTFLPSAADNKFTLFFTVVVMKTNDVKGDVTVMIAMLLTPRKGKVREFCSCSCDEEISGKYSLLFSLGSTDASKLNKFSN